jgi:hypothetical protein
VYEITGKLIVPDDLTHQEMLEELYMMLKENEFHYKGETKEIENREED